MFASGRPAGEGWKSVSEIAEETGRTSACNVKRNLDALVAAGRMEKAKGTIHNRAATFYRPKLRQG